MTSIPNPTVTAGEPAALAPPQPPPPLCFGIEVEMIVFYKCLDKGQDRQEFTNKFPGIIIVPHESVAPQGFVVRHIIKLLREVGLDVNDINEWLGQPRPPLRSQPSRYANNTTNPIYHRWSVVKEICDLKGMELDICDYMDYKYMSVELISPAVRANQDGYGQIKAGIQQIRRLFKVHMNTDTALHIHVSTGPQFMPEDVVKRICILFWATDPILNPLLPKDRQEWKYCRRNRLYAYISHGVKAKEVNNVNTSLDYIIKTNTERAPNPMCSITEGVTELLEVKTNRAVARLTGAKGKYDAYNFISYWPENIKLMDRLKPTIEFRQPAGSMNTEYNAMMVKMYVGLCEAARDMTDDDLMQIAQRCEEIEREELDAAEATYALFEALGLDDVVAYLKRTTPESRVQRNYPSDIMIEHPRVELPLRN